MILNRQHRPLRGPVGTFGFDAVAPFEFGALGAQRHKLVTRSRTHINGVPAAITDPNAGGKWYTDSSGVMRWAPGTAYVHHVWDGTAWVPVGFRWEGPITNGVAEAAQRDLTNGAWVHSNITPTRNQVGADGTANTGTRLAATAANGTSILSFTHTSAARCISLSIKRLTGTGNVQISLGGSTWETVTLSSVYYLRLHKTQTLSNSKIAIRIVTSGDAVTVDYAMGAAGTHTGSFTPGTRIADAANVPSGFLEPIKTSGYIECDYYPDETDPTVRTALFSAIDSGGTGFILTINPTGEKLSLLWNSATANLESANLVWALATKYTIRLAWSGTTVTIYRNGINVASGTLTALNTYTALMYLGTNNAGSIWATGGISRIQAGPL